MKRGVYLMYYSFGLPHSQICDLTDCLRRTNATHPTESHDFIQRVSDIILDAKVR